MKIAIVGSRQIETRQNLDIVLKYMKSLPIGTNILTGSTVGICKFVRENYPKRKKFTLRVYEPNFVQFGNDAMEIANKRMMEESDVVAVAWNGISLESKWIIDYCREHKKDLEIINLKNEAGVPVNG